VLDEYTGIQDGVKLSIKSVVSIRSPYFNFCNNFNVLRILFCESLVITDPYRQCPEVLEKAEDDSAFQVADVPT